MDNEMKGFLCVCVLLAMCVCFITFQIQSTSRKLIEAGFSYKPVPVNTYVTGWSK